MFTINRITLILIALFAITSNCYSFAIDTNFHNWRKLGDGVGNSTTGQVYALTVFNGNIIAGGSFQLAGALTVNNIASWNGTSWSPMHFGLSGDVHALAVYNGQLYAGGDFITTGAGVTVNHIARWNGSAWVQVGNGVNSEVNALFVYNSELVAGGDFDDQGNNIAKWNGTSWSALGQGVTDQVHALTVFEGNLIAAGRFTQAGTVTNVGRIAKWNGSAWSAIAPASFNDRVFALTVYNNQLVAGGRFVNSGYQNLAFFNGSSWQQFGNGVNDEIHSLTVFNGDLIAGGQHEYANTNVFVNRISLWDGAQWRNLGSGTGEKVTALVVKDSSLFAGGEFNYAGGYHARKIAEWTKAPTTSISGIIRYSNGLPVFAGMVYALRMDLYLRQVIRVDSAVIGPNGRYRLNKVPLNDRVIVITSADDELDYVPTYYPATIRWEDATYIIPAGNDSINIRVSTVEDSPGSSVVSGIVDLNYIPLNLVTPTGPFKADAIIYVTSGSDGAGIFKGYTISSNNESYTLPPLPAGQYTLTVNRIGYETETMNINISSSQTVNFVLDTVKYVNINQISTVTPEAFNLYQNYPNPFNPATKIKFDLQRASFITLSIFDISGRKVADIANNLLRNSGTYELQFTAKNMPSGVYFYRLEARDKELSSVFIETKKMILVK